jgi:diacylglycerol kinase family enzyme
LGSVRGSRRLSAIVAFTAAGGAIAVAVGALVQRPLVLLATLVCLGIGIGAATYALTRLGWRRTAGFALAVVALLVPPVLAVAVGGAFEAVVFFALEFVASAAARYALGRDTASLKSGPTPGIEVGDAARPVLLMNPQSGGGKVERFGLVEEARRRGIEPVVLAPGDDLTTLAEDAVTTRGADVIGMAGGDGSQGLVAAVAMRHDVAHVCVPAGTRNHLAMDLGLDRDDVVGALDAFGPAVERRIDLAVIGDRVFVNNATMGLYAKIVQSREYREQKTRTALEMLPAMLGPGAKPFDLRYTGPDGSQVASAHLILVSNDRYELSRPEGFGSRRSIDGGTLGIVAATFRSSKELARFIQMFASGKRNCFGGWQEWTDSTFEVHSTGPIEVGIDGEAMTLDPPIRFRSMPAALRVRLPRHAPGYSPAASTPRLGRAGITALWRTVLGRQVRSTLERPLTGSST